jgi:hypothetical protein
MRLLEDLDLHHFSILFMFSTAVLERSLACFMTFMLSTLLGFDPLFVCFFFKTISGVTSEKQKNRMRVC